MAAAAAEKLRARVREEGEVSSGPEEEAVPAGLLASDNSDKAPKTRHVSENVSSKNNNGTCNIVTSQPPQHIPPSYKSVGKKQVPYRSTNRRNFSWPRNMGNDNLVIRFSDDSDSDSDTDRLNQEDMRMGKHHMHRADPHELSTSLQQHQNRVWRAPVHSRLGPHPKWPVHYNAVSSFRNAASNARLSETAGPWRNTDYQQESNLFTNNFDGDMCMISANNKLGNFRQEVFHRANKVKGQKRQMVPVEEHINDFHRKEIENPSYGTSDNAELEHSIRLAKRAKFDQPLNHGPQCPLQHNNIPDWGSCAQSVGKVIVNPVLNCSYTTDKENNLAETHHGFGEHQQNISENNIARGGKEMHIGNGQDQVITVQPMDGSTHVDFTDLRDERLQAGDMLTYLEEGLTLQSLMDTEELYDKELEEAQEARHACEVEERKALKALRKAQRALSEANERCSTLRRKRELISARIHNFVIEKPPIMLPSCRNSRPVNNVLSLPDDRPPVEDAIEKQNVVPDSQSFEDAILAPVDKSGTELNFKGQELPVDTTSDDKFDDTENACAVHRSNDSPEDYEGCNAVLNNIESHSKSPKNHLHQLSNLNPPSSDSELYYELLEATLRSKLVQRFGNRLPSKSSEASSSGKTSEMDHNTVPSTSPDQHMTEAGNLLTNNGGSMELPESEPDPVSKSYLNSSDNNDPLKDNDNFIPEHVDPITPLINMGSAPGDPVFQPCAALRSIPSTVPQIASRHCKWVSAHGCVRVSDVVPNHGNKIRENFSLSKEARDAQNSVIDPSWPFCLFELRGKCNDEECQCQHVEICSWRSSKGGKQIVTSASGQISCYLSCYLLPIPTYLLGPYVIKAELNSVHPVLAGSIWQYWQRGFCASFPLPLSILRNLPSEALLSQNFDPSDVDQDRNRRLFFIRNQDNRKKKVVQGFPDSEQALELVIDLYSGKLNKPDKLEALSLLARAIENDPKSVVLWVIYLHMYYQKDESFNKDDMFSEAVQHNLYSYELWLLYINSRLQFNDRMDAYNDALNMLCQSTATSEQEMSDRSACILDIFLHMIHFMSTTGNTDKVLSLVYAFVPKEAGNNIGNKVLSDVISCLVTSDKCIFWVCCLYLAIYGMLPGAVIEQFEMSKKFPELMWWPAVSLGVEKLVYVKDFMKFLFDKVAVNIAEDASEQAGLSLTQCLHFLAVSHINCVSVLDGVDAAADLLLKYTRLYPNCAEIFLIAARLEDILADRPGCTSFMEVLINRPRDAPGRQFLWNQYAEHALARDGKDLAEKIMTDWYQAHTEDRGNQDSLSTTMGGVQAAESVSCSMSAELPSTLQSEDQVFWWLNLSLHRVLQSDFPGARDAVGEALKVDSSKYYDHCLREHMVLQLQEKPLSFRAASQAILQVLGHHLGDRRVFPTKELLSRRYYPNIRRLRLRQMIDSILGPVSLDFSVVNSLLAACFGSSLLPERVDEAKDLVDFTESCLEFCPANYVLALSVCRLVLKQFSGSDVSSEGVRFWASSVLVNSVLQAIPAAPESAWLEAAQLLANLQPAELCRRFHQQAISVYPFSMKLWQAYMQLEKITGSSVDCAVEAARQRGLDLDTGNLTLHM